MVQPAGTGPIRVGVVESHLHYRGALVRTLSAPGLTVGTAVGTVAELLAGARPDVVVLGLRLDAAGPVAGAMAVRELTRHGLRVLVLSADEASSTIQAALAAGAAGHLGKSADERAIRAAVRAVATGGRPPAGGRDGGAAGRTRAAARAAGAAGRDARKRA